MNVKEVFESHQLKVKETFMCVQKIVKKDYNKFYSQKFWGSKKRLIYIVAMNLILIKGFNGILSKKCTKVILSNRVD